MSTTELLFIVLFAAGLVLTLAAVFRKQPGMNFLKNVNPVLAASVGILLMVGGFFYGLMPLMPELDGEPTQIIVTNPGGGGTQTVIIDETTIGPSSFDIEPTAGGSNIGLSVNDAETEFTMAIWLDPDADIIRESDNSTAWSGFNCTFQLDPVAPDGATAEDLATIYFEVSGYTVDLDDNEYLVGYDDGDWAIYFTDDQGNNDSYSGSMSMLYTQSEPLWLNIHIDNASFTDSSANENVDFLDSWNMPVTFQNSDWSWSETINIKLIVVGDSSI
jgi:hypothetical protein